MKVIVERRQIVGTLKTLLGTYSLLNPSHHTWQGRERFQVVEDEGFDSWIEVNGDYLIIPASLVTEMDVKRVLNSQEEEELKEVLQAQTDEVLQS